MPGLSRGHFPMFSTASFHSVPSHAKLRQPLLPSPSHHSPVAISRSFKRHCANKSSEFETRANSPNSSCTTRMPAGNSHAGLAPRWFTRIRTLHWSRPINSSSVLTGSNNRPGSQEQSSGKVCPILTTFHHQPAHPSPRQPVHSAWAASALPQ